MEMNKMGYNCFDCVKPQECTQYTPYKNESVCAYSLVAKNDLQKHKDNDPNITLGTMLKEYLKDDVR